MKKDNDRKINIYNSYLKNEQLRYLVVDGTKRHKHSNTHSTCISSDIQSLFNVSMSRIIYLFQHYEKSPVAECLLKCQL